MQIDSYIDITLYNIRNEIARIKDAEFSDNAEMRAKLNSAYNELDEIIDLYNDQKKTK